ncbi:MULTISPECIES: hypothetical protein [unclassified Arthrobacter]|uniref:hypothetical protein n=1 Tax=unclassified Arthrobacter TaxID=235627 RepID=UPI001C865418|nr:hypothetical protein [Arthrobacter sp. MAHUQ-56]MBX7443361.1 hypothetical protein [Arthrobacter sp. MAHUQ-56]
MDWFDRKNVTAPKTGLTIVWINLRECLDELANHGKDAFCWEFPAEAVLTLVSLAASAGKGEGWGELVLFPALAAQGNL